MSGTSGSPARPGWHAGLVSFFTTWRFPALALGLILAYETIVLAMVLMPPVDNGIGRFAEEFRIWCFGYDPATGKSQPMYLFLMLTEPLVLGLLLGGVYFKQLREVARSPRRLLPYGGAALAFGGLTLLALVGVSGRTPTDGELPFPGERIRTTHTPPAFTLIDQEGAPLGLDELRGQVVILTSVYASCNFTCPMILYQAKEAVGSLSEEERRALTVVAITMDPERDTPDVLKELAEGQGVSAPDFRLLTGPSDEVNALLDHLGFARRVDEETGEIDHQNLFLVIDRAGRIAYRFTLGERQSRWLQTALKQLIAEEITTS